MGQEGRIALAGMVMKLFDLWKLPEADKLAFLGLSTGSRMTLNRYQRGGPPNDNRDLMDRVSNLLAIHRSLRILYPHNKEILYEWISTPNLDFGGKAPAAVVCEEGFLGLLMIKRYLDHERGR